MIWLVPARGGVVLFEHPGVVAALFDGEMGAYRISKSSFVKLFVPAAVLSEAEATFYADAFVTAMRDVEKATVQID